MAYPFLSLIAFLLIIFFLIAVVKIIRNFKRIKLFLKTRKWWFWIAFVVFILVMKVIYLIGKSWVAYFLISNKFDYQAMEMSIMIDSTIGIPYSQKPAYKNTLLNDQALTFEEWMSINTKKKVPKVTRIVEGENPDGIKVNANGYWTASVRAGDNDYIPLGMPNKEEATHLLKLKSEIIFNKNNLKVGIHNKLCPNFAFCQVIPIKLQNYVLNYPDLLNNIIEVAKNPCSFIKSEEELSNEKEVIYRYRVGINNDFMFNKHVINQAGIRDRIKSSSTRLNCNNKKQFFGWNLPTYYSPSLLTKKYILFLIEKEEENHQPEQLMQIIVKREDV